MTFQNTQPAIDAVRLEACAQVVSTFLDEQLEALHSGARHPLLVAARDTAERDEEDRLLSVMEEVDALCPLATESFRDGLLTKLRAPGGGLTPAPAEGGGGLDLVETAKLDDWVRLRRLLGRHTEGARAAETHVWERLAVAAGASAHPDDCPVSLQGVCVLFQGAMQNLGAGRDARAAIYDSFEATVVGNLDRLMTDLDALLDDSDVDSAGGEALVTPPPPGATSLAGPAPGDGVGETASGDTVDPARLLGVLAGVARRLDHAPCENMRDAEDFAAQLATAITPPGVDLQAHERHALEVVARLVHQVLEHPEVDAGLKRRLQRLAPPLLMLALQSDQYLEAELDAARHDPVTGLLDRSAFRARLELALRWSADGDRGPAVCLLDVDGLSAITTRLGHQVGGRLLRGLGELLRKHAGAAAFVARIRGDEFAVLLPTAHAGAGRRFAKRYLAALEKARFLHEGEPISLGVSIGVVEFDAGLATPAAVMQAADAARCAAKAAGGGCLCMHDAG